MELKICHLYPDALNLYGDGGNIICMKHRLGWRGIDVTVDGCCIGDTLHASDYDLLFIGAGQSAEQNALLTDLHEKKAAEIRAAVEDGKTFLAICGGFELLGNYCEHLDGTKTEYVGAVNMHTVEGKERLIGDYVFTCDELDGQSVVGFENHAGRTYLGEGVQPLGHVLAGNGNNGTDQQEGARYKNLFGTYAHGCLLPKNPVLADYILKTALETKYGNVELAPLDDTMERTAHQFIVDRLLAAK